MSTKITTAKECDIADILFFIKQLAIYEKLEHEVVATEKTLHETLFGKHKFAEVLFIEEENTKVGFALFFYSYSTFLARPGIYLEDLYVLNEYRGRGYGKRLLTYLAKLSLERGCGRLEWSVLDWNQPAIDFYRSLGAQPMSEWIKQRVAGKALVELAAMSIDSV